MQNRGLIKPIAVTLVVLGLITALSLVSSFKGAHVSSSSLWPFSPLGMITHFPTNARWWDAGCALMGPSAHSLAYLRVFLLTCLLEAPFYALVFFRSAGFARTLAILVTANALTHPFVFFFFPCTFFYLGAILVGEAFAPIVEILFGLAIRRWLGLGIRRRWIALGLLAANLFSWQVGIYFL